jgi:dipeptidyl aminopeptidase/acylaminoacyl peptidase
MHPAPASPHHPSLTCLTLLLLCSITHSRAEKRPLNLLDVARIRQVSELAPSDSGQHIAYTLSVPRRPLTEDDGPAWQELHVVTPNHTSRPFITGPVNVTGIQWRPNSHEISFLQKRTGDEQTSLYSIPVNGGEATRIATHATGIGTYDWNPDGSQIAFLTKAETPKEQKDDEKKGFAAEVFEEDWQPTKVWLVAASAPPDPWLDQEPVQPAPLDLPGSAHAVKWSPNGQLLAISLTPTPGVDDTLMRQKIHIYNPQTQTVTATIETPGKLGQFEWSPDSSQLCLIATTDIHDPKEGRLLVAPVTGGIPTEIVPNYLGHFSRLSWATPHTVLALGQTGTTSEILSVQIGQPPTQILPANQIVVDDLTPTANATHIFLIAQSPNHPPELYQLNPQQPEPERLTDSNPWLAEVQLAKQEVVRYTARDGLELEGILVHPLHDNPPGQRHYEKSGQRYPLILTVHGGPESHQANGWVTTYSRLGQIAATEGFAVFYPNYRGSTGRGVEFSKLGQGDYAGAEFNDLVDAVQHLVNLKLVDPKKVGVTGGSYGGYATAWCATKLTEHFAAGVMFVGISDHISKFGTTDIPDEMYLVHARHYPWEKWDWFLERSPIRYAEQARTPLLILHGKADTRVHPSQSRELFRYLKTHGNTPVRLVEYPGEGHGNRKAASRLDYSIRTLRWFQHYLYGQGGNPPPHEINLTPYRPSQP